MSNLVGKILANRYRIDDSLGRGGMAEVYKAWDLERTTFLALKVLRQDLAQDTVFLRRFQREAQTLARLQHPNIVRFYGIETDDLIVFMLMDYIEGTSLQTEIFRSRGNPLNQNLIYHTTKSVCSALYYAHRFGYVHCDIKPGNIMINQHGEVLLTDFGIARMTDTATATMVGFGTPAFMAPELIRGQDPTPQSDIYSLGVVLYEMATGGERPFTGDRAQNTGPVSEKVRWEQVNLAPSSPKDHNKAIPNKLEKVIMKCLEKDPANRYASALDLLNALELSMNNIEQELAPLDDMKGQNSKNNSMASNQSSYKSGTPQSQLDGNLDEKKQSDKSFRNKIPTWMLWVAGVLIISSMLIAAINLFDGGRRDTLDVAAIQGLSNPTKTEELIISTETQGPLPTVTETLIPTITLTPLPTYGIGSTMSNPVDGATMLFVPEGEFIMGSDDGDSWIQERPVHIVYLDAYWIYKTEVTNSQYRKCIKDGGCEGSVLNYSENDFPATQINWNQAVQYCEWSGGRLPTEAEWEKAARGTDGRKYPWGDESPNCSIANSSSCGSRLLPVGTHLLGASPYGTLEMAGNVKEWVSDWFDETYYRMSPDRNPLGPTQGKLRVIRGGSWYQSQNYLRTTSRQGAEPEFGGNYYGIRCVYTP
jgi:serine/threonine-protein kinase